MIPPLGLFLQGYDHFLRGRGLPFRCDEARVDEALHEATALAAGRADDEPAALLFAFSKRPRALPEGWTFVERCVKNVARVGLRLDLVIEDPFALDLLRLRVLSNQATFEEVRMFMAAHLRQVP